MSQTIVISSRLVTPNLSYFSSLVQRCPGGGWRQTYRGRVHHASLLAFPERPLPGPRYLSYSCYFSCRRRKRAAPASTHPCWSHQGPVTTYNLLVHTRVCQHFQRLSIYMLNFFLLNFFLIFFFFLYFVCLFSLTLDFHFYVSLLPRTFFPQFSCQSRFSLLCFFLFPFFVCPTKSNIKIK